MRKRPPALNLHIPEPCGEDWKAMRDAGPARRHCERCATEVVDVATLTEAQLQRLMERTAGHFCARLTHMADGTLLLREPLPPYVPVTSLLRTPVLAGAVLAGGALPLLAQSGPQPATHSQAHVTTPAFSCAEVTALKHADATQPSIAMPAPAPAPPQEDRAPVVLGRLQAPLVLLRGSVHLPQGRSLRHGIVYADNAGGSKPITVEHNGSYAATLPPGKYTLRVDVEADDGQLYAALDRVALQGSPVTRDLLLQGPVLVTAGVPMAVPPKKTPTQK